MTQTDPQQTDIKLSDVNGLLQTKKLSRNKTALLTRAFFLRFMAPKLQPYPSKVEGQLLTEAHLGTVEITSQPCSLVDTFSVPKQTDIELSDVNGLLQTKKLSRNKTALLTRAFFLRFIAPKLQPYQNKVEGKL